MGRALTISGLALALVALAGLLVDHDDALMAEIVAWVEQTNPYYDEFRIWISLMILAMFLTWAGRYLSLNHPKGNAIPIVWAPLLLSACIFVSPLYVLDHKGVLPFSAFTEDGAMETLTVFLLLISAGLGIAVLRRGRFDRTNRTFLMIFVAGTVFLMMEEISWGQRIFGIDTPEALREVNVQGEINLHNLAVGWNEIVRMVLACVISAILILLPRNAAPGLRGVDETLKPDTRFLPLIPLLIASHVYDEWFEQIVSYMIVSYAWLIYRRTNEAAGDQASI